MIRFVPRLTVAAVFAAVLAAPVARAGDAGELECKMTYSLKGWSAFYKTSKGQGTVTCSNGQSMAVEIKTQPSLIRGKPRLIFQGYAVNDTVGALAPNYDVSPDGQKFLMLQPNLQPAASTQIIVVHNWLEELKRLVPPR